MEILNYLNVLNLYSRFKANFKLRKFKRNAMCDNYLVVSSEANCFCDEGGEISIGHHCDICGILSCKSTGRIHIGNYTTIRGDSIVGALKDIYIGNYVIISNNVHIYDNNNHSTSPLKRINMCISGFYSDLWNWKHSDSSPIYIDDNVWIGERATILKGVRIGRGSIVASNSVVVKDVPSFAIVAGNPANVVKYLEKDYD